jgi:hypothetical protein
MLSAASRVTGLGVGGTFWNKSFVDADKTHLLVAAGDKGAILYTWNISAQRFMTDKALSSKDESSTDYTSGIDSYCAADISRSEDYDAESRTRVFEWLPQVQGFVYSHSLPS